MKRRTIVRRKKWWKFHHVQISEISIWSGLCSSYMPCMEYRVIECRTWRVSPGLSFGCSCPTPQNCSLWLLLCQANSAMRIVLSFCWLLWFSLNVDAIILLNTFRFVSKYDIIFLLSFVCFLFSSFCSLPLWDPFLQILCALAFSGYSTMCTRNPVILCCASRVHDWLLVSGFQVLRIWLPNCVRYLQKL